MYPLLFSDKTLPFEIYYGTGEQEYSSPYFEVLYFLQCISTIGSAIFGLIPLELLFTSMIVCAYVQFDMLRDMLKGMNGENVEEASTKLKYLIKHHEIVLK